MPPLNLPYDGNIPGVEIGVVLAWPCPNCERWARPKTGLCGCLICRLCGYHVTRRELNRLYQHTRSLMPKNLTYN